jgi:glycine betaine/proline transport system permease protein
MAATTTDRPRELPQQVRPVRRLQQLRNEPWALLALVVLAVLAVAGGLGRTFPDWRVPFAAAVDRAEAWVIAERATHWLFTGFFQPVTNGIAAAIAEVDAYLTLLGWPGVLLVVGVLAWRVAGVRVTVVAVACLVATGLLGLWDETMRTMALMLVSVGIALAIGVPVGVWAGRSTRVESALRPVLDALQTTPAYVYLLPMILLFRVGDPAAVVATVVYAVAPAVRLTALGIRDVPDEQVEVGRSVGTTRFQLLRTVQLPLALPSIRVGVNQTIMMALGMVVIGSLIGGTGLGREVLRGLQTLDVGRALDAGIAIVLVAVVLDRVAGGRSATARRGAARRVTARGGAARPRWETPALLVATLVVGLGLGTLQLAAQVPGAGVLSVADQANAATAWLQTTLFPVTSAFSDALVVFVLNPLRAALLLLPWWALTGLVAVAAWRTVSGRFACYAVAALTVVGLLGLWAESMNTLSQVGVAALISIGLAVPIGVMAAHSDRLDGALRPVLDTMQTMPQFVYLIPVVALFNIGRVPGLIASVVYALPPAIRLTNAGIRNLPANTVEAAVSTGATRWQLLRTVELPLAKRSILAGVNQTTMMVLASIIIAGLIGAGGLGFEAITGLLRGEVGRGFAAGLAIVLLGILLDRMTQALGGREATTAARAMAPPTAV